MTTPAWHKVLPLLAALVALVTPARGETLPRDFAEGWQLVTLPLTPASQGSVQAQLPANASLSVYGGGDWQDLRDADSGTLRPGRAFWLLLPEGQRLEVTGSLASLARPFELPVEEGWNLIGSPWPVRTAWDDATVTVRRGSETVALSEAFTRGWLADGLRDVTDPSQDAEYRTVALGDAEALAPWRGYALRATEPVTLLFAAPERAPQLPTATILSPEDSAFLSAPAEVAGTVTSPELSDWMLEVRLRDAQEPDAPWRKIAEGTTSASGVLGTLDTTLLLNGYHELRLTARDVWGRTDSDTIPVGIWGQLKLADYSIIAPEMSVPTPGVPLEVVRVYNYRDTREGDFGVATTTLLDEVRITKSRPLGEDWFHYSDTGPLPVPYYKLGPHPPLGPGDRPAPRRVMLSLPDNGTLRWEARALPAVQGAMPIEAGRMVFDPLPGTEATLTPLTQGNELHEDYLVEPTLGFLNLLFLDNGDTYNPRRFRITFPDGVEYVVDETLGLMSIRDLNGNTVTRTPAGLFHSNGQSVEFARDADGRITEMTDPLGNSVVYEYDATGRLVATTNRVGDATRFAWIEGTTLIKEIDDPHAVNPTFNAWEALERFQGTVDALERHTSLKVYLADRVTEVTDPLGRVTTEERDLLGNIIRITDPDGFSVRHFYEDARHPFRLTRTIDELGYETRAAYDAVGNRTAITDANGNTVRFAYDSRSRVTSITDALGAVTTFAYDAKGNRTSVTDAEGNTTTYAYNAAGQKTLEVGPLGHEVRIAYDSIGNPTSIVEAGPNGEIASRREFAFDGNGNMLQERGQRTNRAGTVEWLETTFAYDAENRALSMTKPDGSTVSRTLNALGQTATYTNELGHTATFEYDDAGRATRQTDPWGAVDTTAFDAMDNVTETVSPRGAVTRFEYDRLDRPVRTIAADGGVSTTEYDAAGRVTATVDPAGRRLEFAYDGNGNVTATVFPDGSMSTTQYNALNLPTVKTRRAMPGPGPMLASAALSGVMGLPGTTEATAFEYDPLRRVTAIRHADGTESNYLYDSLHRLVALRNRLGYVRQFRYDDAYGGSTRRTELRDSLGEAPIGAGGLLAFAGFDADFGEAVESAEYDEYGNRLVERDARGVETTFEYDAMNRTTVVTYADGTSSFMEYDELGRMVRITDRRGVATEYLFSEPGTGQKWKRTIVAGTTAYGIDTTETYDLDGNVVTRTNANSEITTFEHDAFNRVTRATDGLGVLFERRFLPDGLLEEEIDSRGNATRFEYDENRNPIRTVFADGSTVSVRYDIFGKPLEATDQRGNTTTYSYEEGAPIQVHTVSAPEGATTVRKFDALERLIEKTDPEGRVTRYAYDARNRVTQTTDALGLSTSMTYDGNGNLLAMTDARGNVTTYEYDTNGHPTKVTNPGDGSFRTFVPDANGNVLEATNEEGESVLTEYDPFNRAVRVTRPLGRVTEFTHDPVGNVIRVKDPRGYFAEATYDERGRMTRSTNAIGDSVTVQYDANGNVTLERDARGYLTIHEYDVMNRRTATRFADGTEVSMEYDEIGNVVASRDQLGNATVYEYDGLNRLVRSQMPEEVEVRYAYDRVGNQVALTDPRGFVTQTEYDVLNRPVLVTLPTACTVRMEYDENGNVTGQFFSNGSFATNTYDARNRAASAHYSDGTSELYGYDLASRRTSVQDAAGVLTLSAYDDAGRLSAVRRERAGPVPQVQETTYEYDAGDLLTAITDPLERRTVFDYDRVGRRTMRQLPDLSTEFYRYDANGNLVGSRDFQGRWTEREYDALNRITRAALPDDTITFGYDPRGLRESMTDRTGQTTYAYDALGRMTEKDTPAGALAYGYDASGNVTSARSSNGGYHVTYSYDEGNRLLAVADGATSEVLRLTVGYDCFGNETTATLANGMVTERSYDAGNRLVRRATTSPEPSAPTFGYDITRHPLGYPVEVAETGGRRVRYAYDDLRRLIREEVEATAQNGTVDYSHDEFNNRLSRASTLPGVPAVAAYGPYGLRDQVASQEYDPNGNTTAARGRAYRYDASNRLVRADGVQSVNVTYNGDGQRHSKTAADGALAATTRYLVDNMTPTGLPQVVEEVTETDSGPEVTRTYWYGSEPIAVRQRGVTWALTPSMPLVATGFPTTTGAESVLDGDLETTWIVPASPEATLRLEPPAPVHVHAVEAAFDQGAAEATPFSVYANASGGGWQTTRATAPSSGLTESLEFFHAPATSASQVELRSPGRASDGMLGIREARVFAITPSSDDPATSAALALDGRLDTAWTPDAGTTRTLTIEFDTERRLETVDVAFSTETTSGTPLLVEARNPVTDAWEPALQAALPPIAPLDSHTLDLREPRSATGVRLTLALAADPTTTTLPGLAEARVTARWLSTVSLDGGAARFSTLSGGPEQRRFFVHDGAGSVRAMADDDGAITDTFTYDAFGNLLQRTGSTPLTRGFRGEEFDADLGLYYLRARYYDTDTGRFMTMDPFAGYLSEPEGLHRYAFAHGNPAGLHDATGMYAFTLQGFMLDYLLYDSIRKSVYDGWADAPGNFVHGYGAGSVGGTGVALAYLARQRSALNVYGWVGSADGVSIGGLHSDAIRGGVGGDRMVFAMGPSSLAAKEERDAERVHAFMQEFGPGQPHGLERSAHTWEQKDRIKGSLTLADQGERYWLENSYHLAFLRAYQLSADPDFGAYSIEIPMAQGPMGPTMPGVMRAGMLTELAPYADSIRRLNPRISQSPNATIHRAELTMPNRYPGFLEMMRDQRARDIQAFVLAAKVGAMIQQMAYGGFGLASQIADVLSRMDSGLGFFDAVASYAYDHYAAKFEAITNAIKDPKGAVEDFIEGLESAADGFGLGEMIDAAQCLPGDAMVRRGDGTETRIDELRPGMRVATADPGQYQPSETEIRSDSHRLITIHVDDPDYPGSTIEIVTIRDEAWISATRAAALARIRVAIDHNGTTAFGTVVSIDPCPSIEPGPGRVIVTTYKRMGVVYEAGHLRATADHPYYNRNTQRYIDFIEYAAARAKSAGFEGKNEDTSGLRRVGESLVYNLEVEHDHVFYADGELGHNAGRRKRPNLNRNRARSDFGIYEIYVNDKLHKIGKADLSRVTYSSGQPTRLHQQLRRLKKTGDKVDGSVVLVLRNTTTAKAKAAETRALQEYFDASGEVPLGNRKSFIPRPRQ